MIGRSPPNHRRLRACRGHGREKRETEPEALGKKPKGGLGAGKRTVGMVRTPVSGGAEAADALIRDARVINLTVWAMCD